MTGKGPERYLITVPPNRTPAVKEALRKLGALPDDTGVILGGGQLEYHTFAGPVPPGKRAEILEIPQKVGSWGSSLILPAPED